MPSVRIYNLTPNSTRSNDVPNTRVSSFQTGRAGEPLHATGTPIGLLLVWTHAEDVVLGPYGDSRPISRIVNII